MESLLEPFRNAEYALPDERRRLRGHEERVVGFTPEASAYGPICVEFAAAIVLLRTLYAEGRQRILATIDWQWSGGDGAALYVVHRLWWLGGIGIGLRGELGQAGGILVAVGPDADFWGSCSWAWV